MNLAGYLSVQTVPQVFLLHPSQGQRGLRYRRVWPSVALLKATNAGSVAWIGIDHQYINSRSAFLRSTRTLIKRNQLTVSNGAPKIAMSYFATSTPSAAKHCTYGKFAYVVSPAKAGPVVTSILAWKKTACWRRPATGGKVISRAAINWKRQDIAKAE
jgi:hypothetical protein